MRTWLRRATPPAPSPHAHPHNTPTLPCSHSTHAALPPPPSPPAAPPAWPATGWRTPASPGAACLPAAWPPGLSPEAVAVLARHSPESPTCSAGAHKGRGRDCFNIHAGQAYSSVPHMFCGHGQTNSIRGIVFICGDQAKPAGFHTAAAGRGAAAVNQHAHASP